MIELFFEICVFSMKLQSFEIPYVPLLNSANLASGEPVCVSYQKSTGGIGAVGCTISVRFLGQGLKSRSGLDMNSFAFPCLEIQL